MDSFFDIHGNKENKEMFSALIKAEKLSHAYLLSGPCGSGKKMLTLSVATALFLHTSEHSDNNDMCRRIKDGSCPDISFIKAPEDKKTIGVEVVRDFISTVSLSPSDLDFKMYIFDKAEKLTPQAQNALLKVIEEPPKNVYIFLLCENPSSLLRTVRSRVQAFSMERFTPSEIEKYFERFSDFDIYSDRFAFASRVCRGAIGQVKRLMQDDDKFELYKNVTDIIDMQTKKLFGTPYFDFIRKIQSVSETREKLIEFLDFLLSAYRDIMSAKVSESSENMFLSKEKSDELSEKLALDALEISIDAVSKINRDIGFNTNISIASALLANKLWNAV